MGARAEEVRTSQGRPKALVKGTCAGKSSQIGSSFTSGVFPVAGEDLSGRPLATEALSGFPEVGIIRDRSPSRGPRGPMRGSFGPPKNGKGFFLPHAVAIFRNALSLGSLVMDPCMKNRSQGESKAYPLDASYK